MRLCCFVLAAVLLFSTYSCDNQRTIASSQEAGLVSKALEVVPYEATRSTTFYIKSNGLDLSRSQIKWFVNGIAVERPSSLQLESPDIKKNDRISVTATIDGKQSVSNQVVVRNSPPVISTARIIPLNPRANDVLKAEMAGSDGDGDPVTFLFEWEKNGESAGRWDTLEGPFQRDDRISLKITPFDGEDYGPSINLTTNISNSPPKVSEDGSANMENHIYSYQIRAADPDGDQLKYSLKSAPPGATIDSTTGLIRWKIPAAFQGRSSFVISVADGHGGETLQDLNLDISAR